LSAEVTEAGCGKAGKQRTAFQLSHNHDDYELPEPRSAMGYAFQGQGQGVFLTIQRALKIS
ncbi:MAG TPA: hypothetical protein VKW78_14365, partial [Terriglobales bacterium]|nr:hypothetical protein [Terriglobales bacterium]